MKKKYIPISVISLITLLVVQYMLIYNTFALRSNQYQVEEKKLIDSVYRSLVRNEKLYPGGQAIIDSMIVPKYDELRKIYEEDQEEFERYKQDFSHRLFRLLQEKNNMDSLFSLLLKEHKLDKDILYRLVISDFQITFDGKKYINMLPWEPSKNHSLHAVKIGGTLEQTNRQNMITSLTVSSTTANSYRLGFALYADNIDSRFNKILKQMLPTILFSFASIFLVVGLYYFTYRNWIRQKKMAEMTSDFLNSITHEFHTPITTIAVANKNLQSFDRLGESDKVQDLTDIIQRQASRLQKLIKQALNITQLNKYDLQKEEYQLVELIDEIKKDYSLSLDENIQISLLRSPDIELIKVRLNKFLFTTALYNIFDNAIKYNFSERKEIDLTLVKTANQVIISIKDNGIGLEDKQQKDLFRKFHRGMKTKNLPGLGLGLFYVQKVVEAHGWQVDIEGKKGEGVTLSICIHDSYV